MKSFSLAPRILKGLIFPPRIMPLGSGTYTVLGVVGQVKAIKSLSIDLSSRYPRYLNVDRRDWEMHAYQRGVFGPQCMHDGWVI